MCLPSISVIPNSTSKAIRDVCMECFHFLRMLARNNSKVQKRLYEQMDILLEIKVRLVIKQSCICDSFENSVGNRAILFPQY